MYSSSYRNSWALIVGINNYQKIGPLTYAVNDADSIAEVLKTSLAFPANHIQILKDGEATKARVMKEFLAFANKASDNDDRVIFFFAGHGMTKKGLSGDVGYLAPVDCDSADLSSFIRWDDLTRNADLIPAKHILFIIDACYSGLALNRALTPGSQRFVSDMLQRVSRQVLTAGKADQTVADGGPGGNSIFTGHLLAGINGKAFTEEGVLTANILMNYVYQRVAQDTNSTQTPHYGHILGDGDFVLIDSKPTTDVVISVPAIAHEPLEEKPIEADKEFIKQIGYSEPRSASFGRNDLSSRLVESRGTKDTMFKRERAFSWLGLIAVPSVQGSRIDIAQDAKRLPRFMLEAADPSERFRFPSWVYTTLDSVVLFEDEGLGKRENWFTYFRLTKDANIEYADSYYPFYEYDGQRIFKYVQLVGQTWRFLFAVKHLLEKVDYTQGIDFQFNLVGTKDTVLDDFAKGPGESNKHWTDLNEPGYLAQYNNQNLHCQDQNILLTYKIPVSSINPETTREIIVDIANKLGLAYNHQSSPRCFNYNTDVLPWNQVQFIG